jgi:transcription initiation factor TFIIIB Brf1 subunit/transcription initiation factor TFIIB
MDQIIYILIGAVLGFVGSTVGTVVTDHVGERRRMRVRIFMELLPAVTQGARAGQDVEALLAAAVVVGGRDRRLARAVWYAYNSPRGERRGAEVDAAVHEYGQFLAKKLDWDPRNRSPDQLAPTTRGGRRGSSTD